MALVFGGANHRIAADTLAFLAGVALGAEVAVTASRAIVFGWVGALSCLWIAASSLMALIGIRADDVIATRAFALLAGVDSLVPAILP